MSVKRIKSFGKILNNAGQKGYRLRQKDEKFAPLIKNELIVLIEEAHFYIDPDTDKLEANSLKQELGHAKSVGKEYW